MYLKLFFVFNTNLIIIYICTWKSLKPTLKTVFSVHHIYFNLCWQVVDSKWILCSQKQVLNVGISHLLCTKSILLYKEVSSRFKLSNIHPYKNNLRTSGIKQMFLHYTMELYSRRYKTLLIRIGNVFRICYKKLFYNFLRNIFINSKNM